MKLQGGLISVFLIAWLYVISASGQQVKPVLTIESLDELQSRRASTDDVVLVRSRNASHLYKSPRAFSKAVGATNAVDGTHCITNASGTKYLSADRLSATQEAEWFGAVGDGTTDDTAAIKSAIQYCLQSGRPTLQFGAGTFLTDGFTNVGTGLIGGISLVGSEGQRTILRSRSAGSVMQFHKMRAGIIRDIWIDGNAVGTRGIVLSNCTHFTIQKCDVYNIVGKGIEFIGDNNYGHVIDQCNVQNCSDIGVHLNGISTSAITIRDNTFQANAYSTNAIGVRVTGGSVNIRYRDNVFQSLKHGIHLDGAAGALQVGHVIKGNYYEVCSDDSIHFGAGQHNSVTIEDNYLYTNYTTNQWAVRSDSGAIIYGLRWGRNALTTDSGRGLCLTNAIVRNWNVDVGSVDIATDYELPDNATLIMSTPSQRLVSVLVTNFDATASTNFQIAGDLLPNLVLISANSNIAFQIVGSLYKNTDLTIRNAGTNAVLFPSTGHLVRGGTQERFIAANGTWFRETGPYIRDSGGDVYGTLNITNNLNVYKNELVYGNLTVNGTIENSYAYLAAGPLGSNNVAIFGAKPGAIVGFIQNGAYQLFLGTNGGAVFTTPVSMSANTNTLMFIAGWTNNPVTGSQQIHAVTPSDLRNILNIINYVGTNGVSVSGSQIAFNGAAGTGVALSTNGSGQVVIATALTEGNGVSIIGSTISGDYVPGSGVGFSTNGAGQITITATSAPTEGDGIRVVGSTVSADLLAGANITLSTNGSGQITITSSSGGGGSTNGTPLSVNGSAVLSLANLTDLVYSKWYASGSNITLVITNLPQSAISNLVTDLAGKQAANTNLLQIATAAGTPGDLLYRHSSGVLTNRSIGTNGQVLTVVSGVPAWSTVGGATGTTVTINSSAGLSLANFSNLIYSLWNVSGSNITLVITNLPQSAISNLVTDLAGKQAANTNLLQIATAAGTPGDVLYRHSSGVLTNRSIGTNGQVLTVVSGVPAWQTPSTNVGGGSSSTTDGIWKTIAGVSFVTTNNTGSAVLDPSKTVYSGVGTNLVISGSALITDAIYFTLEFSTPRANTNYLVFADIESARNPGSAAIFVNDGTDLTDGRRTNQVTFAIQTTAGTTAYTMNGKRVRVWVVDPDVIISGDEITDIDASLITSGTLDVTRLPSGVMLDSEAATLYGSTGGNNVWTGTQDFQGDVDFSGSLTVAELIMPPSGVQAGTYTNGILGNTITVGTNGLVTAVSPRDYRNDFHAVEEYIGPSSFTLFTGTANGGGAAAGTSAVTQTNVFGMYYLSTSGSNQYPQSICSVPFQANGTYGYAQVSGRFMLPILPSAADVFEPMLMIGELGTTTNKPANGFYVTLDSNLGTTNFYLVNASNSIVNPVNTGVPPTASAWLEWTLRVSPSNSIAFHGSTAVATNSGSYPTGKFLAAWGFRAPRYLHTAAATRFMYLDRAELDYKSGR